MSVAFRSSKRRRRLMEAMVLLRDWPLDLVICFANFLTNIIAWGPMPPVVEKHSGQWGKGTFLNLNDSVIIFGALCLCSDHHS